MPSLALFCFLVFVGLAVADKARSAARVRWLSADQLHRRLAGLRGANAEVDRAFPGLRIPIAWGLGDPPSPPEPELAFVTVSFGRDWTDAQHYLLNGRSHGS